MSTQRDWLDSQVLLDALNRGIAEGHERRLAAGYYEQLAAPQPPAEAADAPTSEPPERVRLTLEEALAEEDARPARQAAPRKARKRAA